ncbi:hypothetical protein RCOM_1382630 [Ricinus communis]|uniref:ADP-ribosyl cyclase/cyclic ADP-ribose hydrolase n=1 Tax=Ricinus communis TaxID=3988 RepID=B9S7X9_RICCO|nr:hypothetical protein RCOM_1382630 [Ricinus communis]
MNLKKYDVFISFRGADIRDGFLSHLYKSLCRNQVHAFVDENLDRGEDITSSLLEIIEQSYVSVVIFSENYAFSPWCLDELVKILECKTTMAQIVLPVFYRVDPIHVQQLTGCFGDAIAKHREEFKNSLRKVETWCQALKETTGMAGLVSQNIKYVRVVGIWGMGGIGKTTVAVKVFDQVSGQFTSRCFFGDVRENLEKFTPDCLQRELLFQVLGKEISNAGMPIMLSSSIRKMLSRRKVLIVLDDVSDLKQIELLIGKHTSYGPRSRIIMTSRDKQLLQNAGAEIYEVEELNGSEALLLFCLHAFKQDSPKKGYMALSERAIKYAQGVPLALKVLGSNLYSRDVEEWEDELEKLKGASDEEIRKVLRISYDELCENEKEIFLDIACFLKGVDKDRAESILDVHGSRIGIRRLLDKSLISISNNELDMHDLLEQMAKDIICQEKQLGKRSRLWQATDIHNGTEAIKGISLDMSSDLELSPTAFQRMDNLRFLKFYNDSVAKPKYTFLKALSFFRMS